MGASVTTHHTSHSLTPWPGTFNMQCPPPSCPSYHPPFLGRYAAASCSLPILALTNIWRLLGLTLERCRYQPQECSDLSVLVRLGSSHFAPRLPQWCYDTPFTPFGVAVLSGSTSSLPRKRTWRLGMTRRSPKVRPPRAPGPTRLGPWPSWPRLVLPASLVASPQPSGLQHHGCPWYQSYLQ